MAAHLLVPVITAVVLYQYLQSISSAAVMHSLPFTRGKLFNSNFITGLLICTVPILVNGLILLLLSKPTFEEWGYGADMTISEIDVFTRADVLNWIGTSLLIVAVLYSIAVFTGIVTGNVFIHVLASFFFIFVVTALYAIFYMYFELYLYGFSASGQWEDICLAISPYTEILKNGGHFSSKPLLFYLFTFVAMYGVSSLLYVKRRLERASDSLVFDFMKPVICYIIAFLGMTLLGMYFYYLGDESKAYLYAGFVAGALIFFIIGKMIIDKTPRVFHLQTLKSFGIFALISVIFILGINYDIAGYEKRTPDPSSIKGAVLEENFDDIINRNYSHEEQLYLQDPANLAALAQFHCAILENRTRFEEESNNLYYARNISFEYDLNSLFDMSRSYTVDFDFYAKSPEMKQIFESLEYKTAISLYGLGAESFDEIELYPEHYMDDTPIVSKDAEVRELIAALEKDIRSMTFEEATSTRCHYASIGIEFTTTNKEGEKEERNVSVNIPYSFDNTITWLNARGYQLSLPLEQISYIDIFKIEPHGGSAIAVDKAIPEGTIKPVMHITDKGQIQKVMTQSDRVQLRENGVYSAEVFYKTNTNDPGMGEIQSLYLYLNEGLDFLKQ